MTQRARALFDTALPSKQYEERALPRSMAFLEGTVAISQQRRTLAQSQPLALRFSVFSPPFVTVPDRVSL